MTANYYTPGRIAAAKRKKVIKVNQQWSRGGAVPTDAEVDLRVDRIVDMDNRRLRYIAECDRVRLMALAEEYRTFGCGMPRTARQIKREAERM